MSTRFTKARFHICTGPASLFERVRFKMAGRRTLRVHAPHLVARANERAAPLDVIRDFDPKEWELVTVEVRTDTGKFVNSAWKREIEGQTWWVVIGLNETLETVIETDKRGLGHSIVTAGELFDRVDKVNRELMRGERGIAGRRGTAEDVWYFAYGSNLWIDQKEERTSPVRTGSDRPRIARLADHCFAFNKRGSNGQVFANVMACPGAEVIGVVYRCIPSTVDIMSEREIGYERKMVTVVIDDGSSVEAITFVALTKNVVDNARPSDEYLARIVTGAEQHGLPRDYIEKITNLAISAHEATKVRLR